MISLSKIYSNQEDIFPTIYFHDGINVVFASVTQKLNSKDSHNLGKTKFVDLLNYMLIKKVKKTFFLKKNIVFHKFVFYLEIITDKNIYITIKREVSGKIYLQTSKERKFFTTLDDEDWEYSKLGVDTAQKKLNELISLDIFKEMDFSYRRGLRYCMRKQNQYEKIFKVNSSREGDINWKPYLLGLLGISSKLVTEKYETNKRAENIINVIKELENIPIQSTQSLEAEITQLEQSLQRKQKELDDFNFNKADQEINYSLALEISQSISIKNKEIYSITHKIQAIKTSLKSEFNFDLGKVQELFKEIELHFPEKLTKSYEELIFLNKQMTIGRKKRLKKTQRHLISKQKLARSELDKLNDERKRLSSILINKSMFEKFKLLQAKLSKEESRLAVLKERLQQADTAVTLKNTLLEIELKKNELAQKLDAETRVRDNPLLKQAVRIFSEYIEEVLNLSIYFFIEINKAGNPEFKINLEDQSSLDDGFSYTRVLAAVFDLTLLSLYQQAKFYRFVYHDGLLESFDDRVKVRLIKLWRKVAKKYGFQLIISVLDSDLPLEQSGEKKYFKQHEIIRELHDRGNDGRLFKMKVF